MDLKMELDVYLERNNENQWGFELSNDSNGRLKITKVIPSSPAEEAGLKEGDIMVKIQGVDTTGLTLDIVMAVIEDVQDKMTIGVTRGLYDPVIDDQEPIFESYEPADFDPQSQPSEVQFKVQQFTQTPSLDPNTSPILVRPTPTLSSPLLQPEPIREPRPLTPVGDSLHYRPFSTEPLEDVPPLEDPIILNPTYRDEFSRNEEDEPKETKYKLPVSEQYDPEGSRHKIEKKDDIIERKVFEVTDDMLKYIKTIEERRAKELLLKKDETRDIEIDKEDLKTKNVKDKESKIKNIIKIDEEKKKEAVKFMKRMRKEIDTANIEKTASNIVTEIVEEAVLFTHELNEVRSDPVEYSIERENIIHNEIKETSKKVKIDEARKDTTAESLKITPAVPGEGDAESKVIDVVADENKLEKVKTEILKEKVTNQEYEELKLGQSKHEKGTKVINMANKEHIDEPDQAPIEIKCDTKMDIIYEAKHEEKELHGCQPNQRIEKKLSDDNDKMVKDQILTNSVHKDVVMEQKIKGTLFEEVKPTQPTINTNKHIEESINGEQVHSYEQHSETEKNIRKCKEMETAPETQAFVEEKSINKTFKNISDDKQITKETQQKRATKEITTEKKEELHKTGYKIEEGNSVGESPCRSQAENRVYTIGLQTIPNICGVVQSNQYDLLLKTFFIHLTDVMVALSRIILTNPGIPSKVPEPSSRTNVKVEESSNQYKKDEKYLVDNHIKENRTSGVNTKKDVKNYAKEEKTYQSYVLKENIQSKNADFEHAQHKPKESVEENKLRDLTIKEIRENEVNKVTEGKQSKSESNDINKYNIEEELKHSKKTGAKMAQLCEKKSDDLTQKMDAVINEFQSKTSIEEIERKEPRRRSKSRSQIEEEVMRESDPLEWLAKFDSRRTSYEQVFNTEHHYSNSSESKRCETMYESKKFKSIKPETAKQMYIAIVESHVYTNRNAIFEDQAAEMSKKTSSMQSSEHVNTYSQTNKTNISENIFLQKSDVKDRTAKIIETRELPIISAKTETNVEITELLNDNQDFSHKGCAQKAATVHQSEHVIVQEMQQVIEPIQMLPEDKGNAKKIDSCTIRDQLSIATNQSTEVIDVNEAKPFEIKSMKTEKGTVSSEQSYNALIVSEVESAMSDLPEYPVSKTTPNEPTLGVESQTAIQISETEAINDDYTKLTVVDNKQNTIPTIGIIEHKAYQVSETETENDVPKMDLHDKRTEVAIVGTVSKIENAIQVNETNSLEDETINLIERAEKQKILDSVSVIPHSAILVNEIKTDKNDLLDLNVDKKHGTLAEINIVEGRDNAVQIIEMEPLKDDLLELNVVIDKTENIQSVGYLPQSAIQVYEAEVTEDDYNELTLSKEQTKKAIVNMAEGKYAAIQISEIEPAKDDYSELDISVASTKLPKIGIVEGKHSAIQISEIEAIEDDFKEIEINREKLQMLHNVSIIEQTALNVNQVEAARNDLSDLNISKEKTQIAMTALVEGKNTALQVNEINSLTHDFAELNINNNSTGLVASVGIVEQTAVHIAQVYTAKVDILEFKVPQKKTEVAQLKVAKKEAKALQIAEVESKQDEFAELNIKKHQLIDITPSVEVKKRSSAVQITEVESLRDEMAQLNISNQKAMKVSESVVEVPTIQITQVETRRDESAKIHIAQQKVADISASAAVKVSKPPQVKIIKSEQEEFAELNLKKHIVNAPSAEENSITGVKITEIDAEEEASKHKVLQNGFARTAEIMSQNKIEAKNESAGFNAKMFQSKYETQGVQMCQESSLTATEHSETSKQYSSSQYVYQTSQRTNSKNLSLLTDLSEEYVTIEEITSPPLTPPTPLVDEYIFRLQAPLPKSRGTTPVPPDYVQATVNHEDPHIVKKKLIPHIELTIEQIIYDPPLPTPPEDKPCPIYSKPGLKGGTANFYFYKEEIKEIEKKTSLITSAIDQTIKSIEEYNEEIGMTPQNLEMKKEIYKSEYSCAKTTLEKNISNKIVLNGDIVNDKHFDIDEVKVIPDKEENEAKKEIHEIEQNSNESSNVTNMDENKTDIETGIKINTDTQITTPEPQTIETENDKVNIMSQEVIALEKEDIALQKLEEMKNSNEVEVKTEPNVEASSNKTEKNKIKNEKEDDISKETNNTDKVDIEIKINGEASLNETETEEIKQEKQENERKELDSTKTVTQSEVKAIITNTSNKENDNTEDQQTSTKEIVKGAEIKNEEDKIDYLQFVKPVKFDPEAARSLRNTPVPFVQEPIENQKTEPKLYVSETGEVLGTIQGIVDGLEEPVLDEEVAKELGKPGLPEERIAELISGEADILREAHVMGLSRVLSSHMHRAEEEPEVTIKPMVNSLNKSEVLKALNEEILQKKLEEQKRWTTFLQKPKRPVPKAKFGYHGYVEEKENIEEPYKVLIVKQPKPRIAPDFKPEDFDTGPLPWEERAVEEASLPPVEPEQPILVPEEPPQFLEAVDPLPESEIPDLEDTGLPLPVLQPKEQPVLVLEESTPTEVQEKELHPPTVEKKELPPTTLEEAATMVPEEDNRLAEDLIKSVQSMVDPNASLEQQLAQMRAQLAALAKLPGVIQQTLELVTQQLMGFSIQGMQQTNQALENQINNENQEIETVEDHKDDIPNGVQEDEKLPSLEETQQAEIEVIQEDVPNGTEQEANAPALSPEELERMKKEEEARLEEERKSEKQKKEYIQREREARQLKQRPTPRVGKPKPMFGPLNPEDRPLILPGGRKWRRPQDAFDDQLIAEVMQANSEVIQGKAIGINFMKYEPPPVSLEHLKNSEVYKVVHNMDEAPLKRVELLGPVIAEADYRKRCRSRTPNKIEEYNYAPQFQL